MKGVLKLVQLIVLAALLACTLSPVSIGYASPTFQATDPAQKANDLLNQLTPEERVGQLFLVTFQGSQVDQTSQIYDLITQYHIGGVMLLAENDNFSDTEGVTQNTLALTQALQTAAMEVTSNSVATLEPGTTSTAHYIPLFIGISQEGDGYPNDQILSGLTTLPSEMALGATWDRDLAEQVGEVLGNQLHTLGFNMLFGPSLDVLDQISDSTTQDTGISTFGGDPFWVQELGSAYVSGVHTGSQNQIAVIANHFPGLGSSDRSPDVEVATVRKTLEQLQQIELPPFFAVTGNASSSEATIDGVLVSHVRYLFQGNIRATTRPISLDSSALQNIMSVPQLQSWQQNGGLLVSDDLGSRALRRFYDPSEKQFNSYQVAREAFLAGNDLLYVNDFTATGDPDSYTSLVNTLDFFTRKYNEDDVFAQRVNQSLLKILTLKYRLYQQFSQDKVIQSNANLDSITNDSATSELLFETARSAVTLISPTLSELPDPPSLKDRIVFITDTGSHQQCTKCNVVSDIDVDAFQNAVLRLYGPNTGGQVTQNRMSSYSFIDLLSFLNETAKSTPEPSAIESDLNIADWVIISMREISSTRVESDAIKRLLNERSDILKDKNVVVFAFNGPYFLDATDISKLSAYYALYSKTSASIEVAARVLFQELIPPGSSPVSISGIGYNIIDVTSPDPDQIIGLGLDTSQVVNLEGKPTAITLSLGTLTVEPTQVPTFKKGDTIPLVAGPILDHNGRPVPDGTVVRFIFTLDGGASGEQQVETYTAFGTGEARTSYKIEKEGLLDIRVTSDEATRSYNLKLDISEGEGAAVSVIQPTDMPTVTPSPTDTPTPVLTETPDTAAGTSHPSVSDWLIAVLMTAALAAGGYVTGVRIVSLRWGLRWGLCALIGGMLGYSYLAVGLPGGSGILASAGTLGVVAFTLSGIILGTVGGIVWWNVLEHYPTRR